MFQSCEKKTLTDTENGVVKEEVVNADKNLQTVENTVYYLDDKEVTKEVIDNCKKNNNPFIIQTAEKNTKTGIITVLIYVYTTKEGYINYGEKHNLKLKEELQFAEHMRKYAEKTGAIEKYEKTGIVSESYLQYEKKYYNKIFGNEKDNKTWFVTFYKEHNRQGSSAIMANTLPFMWPGWNNKTSCIYKVGIAGGVSLFDKIFYRKHLITIWGWDFNTVNLYGNADNATSSAVRVL